MPLAPTYRTEISDTGAVTYVCLYCEEQGSEHHSTDAALFEQHMHQRHDGRLVAEEGSAALKAPADADHPQGGPPGQTGEHPDHPHGAPPGQSGEHPDHPHGAPPGQSGEKPDEEEPHVENPITLPEVEHHEEPKPEEGV